jgi:hypothetical protein
MTTKFIDAEAAIKKLYKSRDDFFAAVREGDEPLYIPVKKGSVYSFFENYLTPYLKVPYPLVAPVNHGFINLLVVPEEKVAELEEFGLCHCDVFEGAACLDQAGNLRRYELGSFSQVPDEDGLCRVEVQPDRLLVEQIKKGGLYEVNGSAERECWPAGEPMFAENRLSEPTQKQEVAMPPWFRSDEEESREYEAMLPQFSGRDRQGNLTARLFSYVYGIYDHPDNLVEDLPLGMKVRTPKSLAISLHDIRVIDRESAAVVKKRREKPLIKFDSPEVEAEVKKLLAQYETNGAFAGPHFSTRLSFYLRLVIAHWMACETGGRPESGRMQRDLLDSGIPFLKEHAKALTEYALNRYQLDSQSSKGERIRKAHRADQPWELSVVPTILALWRDKVATLESGIAKDAKEWGDDIKRALTREGVLIGVPTAIAALIAPDNTEMSDKYNGINRIKMTTKL